MLWNIIFVMIGIGGMYFLYRLMKKEALEGRCGACPPQKGCREKKCGNTPEDTAKRLRGS